MPPKTYANWLLDLLVGSPKPRSNAKPNTKSDTKSGTPKAVTKSSSQKSAKKSAKPVKKPAAKAAASKASPAKKAPVKPVAKPAKAAAKPAAKAAKVAPKPAVKASAKPAKPVEKVEKLTKAQLAIKAKEDAKKAKLAAKGPQDAKAPVPPAPLKAGSKIAPKKPGENETPGDADSPLLDMSDVGVRKMIAKAKARGYVTYDELNKVLPSDKTSSEQIEDTMAMLNEMGINVIESEEAEEGEEGGAIVPAAEGSKALATTAKSGEQYDRTDDPVRMYLREMGSVELLSREGEIAIAKRIEAGRELMIGALCESPLTFEALTVWRDELNEGKVLLRDIIDLEAMYGAGPDGSACTRAAAGQRSRRPAAAIGPGRIPQARNPQAGPAAAAAQACPRPKGGRRGR